jgi:hypothetical protein
MTSDILRATIEDHADPIDDVIELLDDEIEEAGGGGCGRFSCGWF